MRKKTNREIVWLEDNIPNMTMETVIHEFDKRFGWVPNANSIRALASRRRINCKERWVAPDKASKKVVWKYNKDMAEWFDENDYGQCTGELSEMFEKRFGFPLSTKQICLRRHTTGTQSKKVNYSGKLQKSLPVGTERVRCNVVYVKVDDSEMAEGSNRPWRQKSHVMWERYKGEPFPSDCMAIMANGDNHDFSEENIVAVPLSLAPQVARMSEFWNDRETLDAVVAYCELNIAITTANMRERPCVLCGKSFVPPKRSAWDNVTCPECLSNGRHFDGVPKIRKRCAVCGEEFMAMRSHYRRCKKCTAESPKATVAQQRKSRVERGLPVFKEEE